MLCSSPRRNHGGCCFNEASAVFEGMIWFVLFKSSDSIFFPCGMSCIDVLEMVASTSDSDARLATFSGSANAQRGDLGETGAGQESCVGHRAEHAAARVQEH